MFWAMNVSVHLSAELETPRGHQRGWMKHRDTAPPLAWALYASGAWGMASSQDSLGSWDERLQLATDTSEVREANSFVLHEVHARADAGLPEGEGAAPPAGPARERGGVGSAVDDPGVQEAAGRARGLSRRHARAIDE